MSKILIDEATVKLVLEALESCDAAHITDGGHQWYDEKLVDTAYAALQEALAEQPAQQDNTCNNALREQGKAYPRTCKKCGLGPCVELAQQALDKMAENARELGLMPYNGGDYEPAPVAKPHEQEPLTFDGMTAQEFALKELYAFQEATGCDTADQIKAREPLTDEELYKVFPAIATYTEANKTLYRSIARAIEAAHGIKGDA